MGRAPCCSKVGLNRGRWTTEEDKILAKYIQTHGEGSWRELPINAGLLRCGKSCRLRWINYLRSGLKRGNVSAEEEELIIRLHAMLGNRWSMIAGRMPGRTDNDIKNYWNTHLSKKLAVRGIDPMTHKPFYYNANFEKKSENEQDVSSSIESCIFLNQKKPKEIKKSMKKTPPGTRKRNKVADPGHLKKKIGNMEQVSSRISNHSSSEFACSEIENSSSCDPHPNEAEPSSSGKLQPQGCNSLVENSDDKSNKENGEPKFLLRHEYPTSSLTMNSSCLWDESFPSKMLPSDMDFFGSVDTSELMTFENQLPDPSPASDEYNGNIETGDLWSFFLSDVKE